MRVGDLFGIRKGVRKRSCNASSRTGGSAGLRAVRTARLELLEDRVLLDAGGLPDDPYLPLQYHHDADHMNNVGAWQYLLDAPGIPADHQYGDPDLIVAVVDVGFDIEHEDLQANIMVPDGPFADPAGGSHGTSVAGVVAAVADNGLGGAGTAGGVRILPIRVDEVTPVALAEAFDYAVAKGARIVTSSLLFESDYDDWTDATYLAALDNMARHDVLHINAAGDDNLPDLHFRPAQSLHVASTDRDDRIMIGLGDFGFPRGSAYGTQIDIAAPGTHVLTTQPYDHEDGGVVAGGAGASGDAY